jgi:hypothetical protein
LILSQLFLILKNMRKINILIISAAFFILGCKKNNPAPTPTSSSSSSSSSSTPVTTVIVAQNINNRFSLGSTTYNPTIAMEETQVDNGISFYILTIVDSARTTGCEFWFKNKPSAGTYTVSDMITSFSNGVSVNHVGIAVLNSGTDYLSQNTGSITISTSGNNLIVTASGIPLINSSNSADVRNLSTIATIP